jgi:hypothetical protein
MRCIVSSLLDSLHAHTATVTQRGPTQLTQLTLARAKRHPGGGQALRLTLRDTVAHSTAPQKDRAHPP